jgi:hypothetical protein
MGVEGLTKLINTTRAAKQWKLGEQHFWIIILVAQNTIF